MPDLTSKAHIIIVLAQSFAQLDTLLTPAGHFKNLAGRAELLHGAYVQLLAHLPSSSISYYASKSRADFYSFVSMRAAPDFHQLSLPLLRKLSRHAKQSCTDLFPRADGVQRVRLREHRPTHLETAAWSRSEELASRKTPLLFLSAYSGTADLLF